MEIISLASKLFSDLKISHKIQVYLFLYLICKLQINTLGDEESRIHYKQVLTDYFNANKQKLSAESLKR